MIQVRQFIVQMPQRHFYHFKYLYNKRTNKYNCHIMINIKFKDSIRHPSVMVKSALHIPQKTPVQNTAEPTCRVPPFKTILEDKNCRERPLTICALKDTQKISKSRAHLPPIDKPDDLKGFYTKKIEELMEELKKILKIYIKLEKDENRCKIFILNQFRQLEETFLHSLSIQQDKSLASKEFDSKNLKQPSDKRRIVSIRSGQPATSMQIDNLKQEIQTYKRNNAEAVEKFDEIFKMVKEANVKYQREIKENKALSEAITAYTDDAENILLKINLKQQKEKKITLLQREIQQILIKLKFKAFTYTIKPQ